MANYSEHERVPLRHSRTSSIDSDSGLSDSENGTIIFSGRRSPSSERYLDTEDDEGWIARSRRSPTTALVVVCLSLFIDLFVYAMIIPFMPVYAKQKLHASDFEVGLLFASYALGIVAFCPVFGIFSDKIGRRTPMLLGIAGLGVSTLLFMIADTFVFLFLARLAQGISASASYVVGPALVADLYPAEQLGQVLGIVISVNGLGTLIGPALGGFIYQHVGYESVFILAAILTLIDFLGRLYITEPPPREEQESPIAGINSSLAPPHTKVSTWSLITQKPIALLCCATTISGTALTFLEPTLTLYFSQTFHFSSSEIGMLFTCISIGFAIVAAIVGYFADRFSKRAIIAIGLVIEGLSWPTIALSDNPTVSILVCILVGSTIGISSTPQLPYLAELADHSERGNIGKVFAIYTVAYSCGMFLGPLFAGLLQYCSYFTVLCILGGMTASAGLLFYGFTTGAPDASAERRIQRKEEEKAAKAADEADAFGEQDSVLLA